MTLKLLLIILLIILVGCSGSKIWSRESYINPKQCYKGARINYKDLNLPTASVHSCEVEELPFDGETIKLIKLSVGPGMDCPSGCIYQPLHILTHNEWTDVIDFHETRKMAYEINELLYVNHPPCTFGYEILEEDTETVTRTITKKDDLYRWKLFFNNYQTKGASCNINGVLVIDIPVDFSSLDFTTNPPNCELNPKVEWGLCALYYDDISYCENIEFCQTFQGNEICKYDIRNWCYYNVALKTQDASICNHITKDDTKKNNCINRLN